MAGKEGTEGKMSKAQYKEMTSGDVFGTLRILVVGRPKSGKTTLIKLLLGFSNKQGPEIHEAEVAIQPPQAEDPNAPKPGLVKQVLKHTRGNTDPTLKEVQIFLKARQKKSVFSERVHMVWFVMSALDDQNATNAKVLRKIGSL